MDNNLKKLHSEESRQKAKETRENSIKQLAIPEEQETHLLIDYYDRKLKLYTTKATVMNRLARMGYIHKDQATYDGEIFSRSYEFYFADLGKFLRVNIFGVKQERIAND